MSKQKFGAEFDRIFSKAKEEQTVTDTTKLIDDTSKAVGEFNATRAGIESLRARFDGAVYDVTTPKGMTLAKEARAEIKRPRVNIEKLRKAAKAPILELGRAIDGRAKELTAELVAIEEPIDAQIKIEEQRVADEKAAAEEAERQRVGGIHARIEELRAPIDIVARYSSDSGKIQMFMDDINQIDIEGFDEFTEQALRRKETTLTELSRLHAVALQREADARELEALRKEKAEREATPPELDEAIDALDFTEDAPIDRRELDDMIADGDPAADVFVEAPTLEIETAEIQPITYPGVEPIVEVLRKEFGIDKHTAEVWISKAAVEVVPF